jgi:hypothetical protein
LMSRQSSSVFSVNSSPKRILDSSWKPSP